jgi:hypothetical protein
VEKGETLLLGKKLVGSLDVIARILDDPEWRERAEKVKTINEMRKILIDFCKANGEVVQVDRDTLWIYAHT